MTQRHYWTVIAACVVVMIGTPIVVAGFEVVIVWALTGTVLAFTLVFTLTSDRTGR